MKEYIGKRFHNLTIVEYQKSQPNGNNCKCKCSCGNLVWVRYGNMVNGSTKGCGCLAKKNLRQLDSLLGKKFGHLTLIGYNKEEHYKWKFKCDCGNTCFTTLDAVQNGLKKTCSSINCQYHTQIMSRKSNMFSSESISTFESNLLEQLSPAPSIPPIFNANDNSININKKWQSLLKSARYREIPVEISKEDMEHLYNYQNRRCALTKIPLNTKTASLDRINSQKGYVNGNVQWIFSMVNMSKLFFDQNYFINMCNRISNFCKSHTLPIFVPYKAKNKTTYSKQEIPSRIWRKIKNSAKRRKIPFELNILDAEAIFKKQGGVCALSGLPIKLRPALPIKMVTASLDRVSPNLGYTKNNIQWVHKHVNLMKSLLDNKTFIILCNVISKNFSI